MATPKNAEQKPLVIGGERVDPGETVHLELSVARLPTYTKISIPIVAVHGTRPGPKLWVSSSVHGDELNGIEIIHQVLDCVDASGLRGTLIAVPIVNVFGFIHKSRYLPDGRDLNRSFPGTSGGSLAARMAKLFMTEVVTQCTHGVDLHTGSGYRTNLPQIRANLDSAKTREFALAFGAPVTMHSHTRDGSLRYAAMKKQIPVLVYEGGEAHCFDEEAIAAGVRGVCNVIRFLKMQRMAGAESRRRPTQIMRRSKWMRAKRGGLLRLAVNLGDHVAKGQTIGNIGDPFGGERSVLKSSTEGIVVGVTRNPVVYQGDALVHVAS